MFFPLLKQNKNEFLAAPQISYFPAEKQNFYFYPGLQFDNLIGDAVYDKINYAFVKHFTDVSPTELITYKHNRDLQFNETFIELTKSCTTPISRKLINKKYPFLAHVPFTKFIKQSYFIPVN